MKEKSVNVLVQRRAFVEAMNDLSSGFVIKESLNNFYDTYYREMIEESLIEKDEKKFNHYAKLLSDLT